MNNEKHSHIENDIPSLAKTVLPVTFLLNYRQKYYIFKIIVVNV